MELPGIRLQVQSPWKKKMAKTNRIRIQQLPANLGSDKSDSNHWLGDLRAPMRVGIDGVWTMISFGCQCVNLRNVSNSRVLSLRTLSVQKRIFKY
ncbi:hypothetical protein X801_09298 [Opisthorchis viverrini]|uniref:Uncharacterized protein n=1 Tax=Opisthorchis viverrini TaxID=6198 RepID=A0A1S8WKD8_OPIVI|nr:hypothetical protein X801_09298 [Opisthorchis viverrini]